MNWLTEIVRTHYDLVLCTISLWSDMAELTQSLVVGHPSLWLNQEESRQAKGAPLPPLSPVSTEII